MGIFKPLMGGTRVLLLCVVSALLCFGLIACGGKSSEEVIREGITAKFESLKNLDEDTIESVLGDYGGSEYFDALGVDYVTFCKTWFDGFDYEIGDVVVDGDNATVAVTVTIKSLTDASTAFEKEIGKMTDSTKYADMSEEELYKEFGKAFMDCVENAKMVTTTVEIPYVHNGNTWEPGAGFNAALNKAFVGSAN